MTRLPLILLLAFPAFALAGGEGWLYRFDRSSGMLTVEVPFDGYAYDTHDGAAFSVTDGYINLSFYGWRTESDWISFTLQQLPSGVCLTDGGPNHELKARFPDFVILVDTRPDFRAILDLAFARLGQPQVMVDSDFFRIRDGELGWTCDGETETACRYYLPELDADDYRVRTDATMALTELGENAALWLWQIDPRCLTAEQGMRVEAVLKDWPVRAQQ